MSQHAQNRPFDRFDPFGERLDVPRAAAMATTGRRTGMMGLALFWALALVLLAGRLTLPVAATSDAPLAVASDVVRTGSLR